MTRMKLTQNTFVGAFLFALLFLPLITNAQDELQRKIDSANTLYQQQLFAQANEIYLEIFHSGYESSSLFYNIGNTYYKLSNYPKAILYYERALLLDPKNEDVLFNLEKAKLYNIDKIDEIPEFFIHRIFRTFATTLPSNTWSIFSLLFIVIFITFGVLFIISRKIGIRKLGFFTALVSLFLSSIFFFLAYKSKSYIAHSTAAIVMSPTVTVKSSPNLSSGDLFIIHEGTKVQVTDSLDTWKEIRLSDGKQGWIPKKFIEKI